jgi:hypothetical protein
MQIAWGVIESVWLRHQAGLKEVIAVIKYHMIDDYLIVKIIKKKI